MPTLTPDELADLAADLASTLDRINQMTQEADRIKAAIREGVPGPDDYTAGALTVRVGVVRRLNQTRALANLPTNLRDACVDLVEKVDGPRLKILAPEVYDASCTDYPFSVSVS